MEIKKFDADFLKHVEIEFGTRGQRAVRCLTTARSFLLMGSIPGSPMLAPSIAYLLREAMHSLLDSPASVLATMGTAEKNRWGKLSRDLVKAIDFYERTIEDESLNEQAAFDIVRQRKAELDKFHNNDNLRTRQLITIMLKRTSYQLSKDTLALKTFLKLFERANIGLHSDISMQKVHEMWEMSVDTFQELFSLPDIRDNILSELASIEYPTSDDIDRLQKWAVSPLHYRKFFESIRSPYWLNLLYAKNITDDTCLINPPVSEAPWPALAAFIHLKEHFRSDLTKLLCKLLERNLSNRVATWHIARAAYIVEGEAFAIIQKAVSNHPYDMSIASLGLQTAEKVAPANNIVSELVGSLIQVTPNFEYKYDNRNYYISKLLDIYTEGCDEINYIHRVKLLCLKLEKIPEQDNTRHLVELLPDGSLDDYRKNANPRGDLFLLLLDNLLATLRKSESWASAESLLDLISVLPEKLLRRIRPYFLATSETASCSLRIREIERAIKTRGPVGDDLLLLDSIIQTCEEDQYVDTWKASFSSSPTDHAVAIVLSKHSSTWKRFSSDDRRMIQAKPFNTYSIPLEWCFAIQDFLRLQLVSPFTYSIPLEWCFAMDWNSILPIEKHTEWEAVAEKFSALREPYTRESLEFALRTDFFTGSSPFSVAEILKLDPEEAAKQIAAWRPTERIEQTAILLARSLESAVEAEPHDWLYSPEKFVKLLQHPTYISHYFSGLARAFKAKKVKPYYEQIDKLFKAILLVKKHPWPVTRIGKTEFDYIKSWKGAESSILELISALAESEIGFGNCADKAFELLREQIRDRSSITLTHDETERISQDSALDLFNVGYNRPCTYGMYVLIKFLQYEYQTSKYVRPDALTLIEECLELQDLDGQLLRAMIAPRIDLLLYIAMDWFETKKDLFFGRDVPRDHVRVTIDSALLWGNPVKWLLENYRGLVFESVERGTENAMLHVLSAMLYQFVGYSPDEVAKNLAKLVPATNSTLSLQNMSKGLDASLVSVAAQELGRNFDENELSTDQYKLIATFWRETLAAKEVKHLSGFGWLSRLVGMSDNVWADLTIQTLSRTGGYIGWEHGVAERAGKLASKKDAMIILDYLLRAQKIEDLHDIVGTADKLLESSREFIDSREYNNLKTSLHDRKHLAIK